MKIISYLIEAHIFRVYDSGLEFLLLKRSKDEIYPGLWQMVTGKIKDNEKAFEAALREIKEETGLLPEKFWVTPTVNSFYEPVEDYICEIPVFAAKVDINSDVKISSEHSEYIWASVEAAKNFLAWPGQRNAVDIINHYFTKQTQLLNFVEINL